ncbi:MAG: hypothetical protein GC159_17525 [Phycisphaera sp.]|nr:hypothetical protein [Phycisphaera sp.]
MKLDRFWRTLEALPGHTDVIEAWRRYMLGELPLIRGWLVPTDEAAPSYPCPAKWCGTRHNVVTFGADDHVAINHDCHVKAALKDQDIAMWRLDMVAVRRAIASAMGVAFDDAAIDGAHGTHRVGWYEPVAGFRFGVYMTTANTPDWFDRAVLAVAGATEGPFMLLAPTDRSFESSAERMVRQRRGLFVSLRESLAFDGACRIVAADGLDVIMRRFRDAVLPKGGVDPEPMFFATPTGSTWSDVSIRFLDGHTVTVRVGDVVQTLNYTQMGMVDLRSGSPSAQWELLRVFADEHGTLTWRSRQADRRNAKRKERLARDLGRFLRIEGDPFEWADGGWRARFHILDGA